ncbi:MAG: hypothetical protein CG446_342 [Methanosaeta sp. ASO1]|nr:MAG: hypothetical protein CG446_342 [Methanosaeta sp. ASO1]
MTYFNCYHYPLAGDSLPLRATPFAAGSFIPSGNKCHLLLLKIQHHMLAFLLAVMVPLCWPESA